MKRNLILSLVVILSILLMAQFSFARTLAQAKSQTAKRMAAPKPLEDVEFEVSPYKLSAVVSLSYEQSAEETNGQRSRGLGLYFAPKFEFYDFSFRSELFYGYDLNDPKNGSGMADGVFSLLYDGWKLTNLKFSPFTSVELPLSDESRENREIELVNNLGLIVALDSKALNIPNFRLSYSAAYGYYTNKYTTRVNGEPATEYKIVQTLKSGYNFNPVSIGMKFQYTSAYSYEDVVRDGFLLQESIAYTVNQNFDLVLYHYNRAPFLKTTTYENNLQAYDKQTSTVGLSTDFSF
jgi:hypothetical protein